MKFELVCLIIISGVCTGRTPVHIAGTDQTAWMNFYKLWPKQGFGFSSGLPASSLTILPSWQTHGIFPNVAPSGTAAQIRGFTRMGQTVEGFSLPRQNIQVNNRGQPRHQTQPIPPFLPENTGIQQGVHVPVTQFQRHVSRDTGLGKTQMQIKDLANKQHPESFSLQKARNFKALLQIPHVKELLLNPGIQQNVHVPMTQFQTQVSRGTERSNTKMHVEDPAKQHPKHFSLQRAREFKTLLQIPQELLNPGKNSQDNVKDTKSKGIQLPPLIQEEKLRGLQRRQNKEQRIHVDKVIEHSSIPNIRSIQSTIHKLKNLDIFTKMGLLDQDFLRKNLNNIENKAKQYFESFRPITVEQMKSDKLKTTSQKTKDRQTLPKNDYSSGTPMNFLGAKDKNNIKDTTSKPSANVSTVNFPLIPRESSMPDTSDIKRNKNIKEHLKTSKGLSQKSTANAFTIITVTQTLNNRPNNETVLSKGNGIISSKLPSAYVTSPSDEMKRSKKTIKLKSSQDTINKKESPLIKINEIESPHIFKDNTFKENTLQQLPNVSHVTARSSGLKGIQENSFDPNKIEIYWPEKPPDLLINSNKAENGTKHIQNTFFASLVTPENSTLHPSLEIANTGQQRVYAGHVSYTSTPNPNHLEAKSKLNKTNTKRNTNFLIKPSDFIIHDGMAKVHTQRNVLPSNVQNEILNTSDMHNGKTAELVIEEKSNVSNNVKTQYAKIQKAIGNSNYSEYTLASHQLVEIEKRIPENVENTQTAENGIWLYFNKDLNSDGSTNQKTFRHVKPKQDLQRQDTEFYGSNPLTKLMQRNFSSTTILPTSSYPHKSKWLSYESSSQSPKIINVSMRNIIWPDKQSDLLLNHDKTENDTTSFQNPFSSSLKTTNYKSMERITTPMSTEIEPRNKIFNKHKKSEHIRSNYENFNLNSSIKISNVDQQQVYTRHISNTSKPKSIHLKTKGMLHIGMKGNNHFLPKPLDFNIPHSVREGKYVLKLKEKSNIDNNDKTKYIPNKTQTTTPNYSRYTSPPKYHTETEKQIPENVVNTKTGDNGFMSYMRMDLKSNGSPARQMDFRGLNINDTLQRQATGLSGSHPFIKVLKSSSKTTLSTPSYPETSKTLRYYSSTQTPIINKITTNTLVRLNSKTQNRSEIILRNFLSVNNPFASFLNPPNSKIDIKHTNARNASREHSDQHSGPPSNSSDNHLFAVYPNEILTTSVTLPTPVLKNKTGFYLVPVKDLEKQNSRRIFGSNEGRKVSDTLNFGSESYKQPHPVADSTYSGNAEKFAYPLDISLDLFENSFKPDKEFLFDTKALDLFNDGSQDQRENKHSNDPFTSSVIKPVNLMFSNEPLLPDKHISHDQRTDEGVHHEFNFRINGNPFNGKRMKDNHIRGETSKRAEPKIPDIRSKHEMLKPKQTNDAIELKHSVTHKNSQRSNGFILDKLHDSEIQEKYNNDNKYPMNKNPRLSSQIPQRQKIWEPRKFSGGKTMNVPRQTHRKRSHQKAEKDNHFSKASKILRRFPTRRINGFFRWNRELTELLIEIRRHQDKKFDGRKEGEDLWKTVAKIFNRYSKRKATVNQLQSKWWEIQNRGGSDRFYSFWKRRKSKNGRMKRQYETSTIKPKCATSNRSSENSRQVTC